MPEGSVSTQDSNAAPEALREAPGAAAVAHLSALDVHQVSDRCWCMSRSSPYRLRFFDAHGVICLQLLERSADPCQNTLLVPVLQSGCWWSAIGVRRCAR